MARSPGALRPDYEMLAASAATLEGRMDAAEFSGRLAAALCAPVSSGAVDYRLSFSRGEEQAVAIRGALRARLAARCQRCLGNMELDVEVPVKFLIPAFGTMAPPTGWEATEAGARPALAELIEEELLLALPFAPVHPNSLCAAVAAGSAADGEPRSGPFADLATLLRRKRD